MVSTALATVGSAIGGAITKQARPARRARAPSRIIDISSIDNIKIARIAKKDNQEQRIYDLLSSPEILGLVMVLAGVYASNHIDFSDSPAANAGLQGTATIAAVLMGLGHAGVGDLTSVAVAGAAGASSLLGGGGGGGPWADTGIWGFLSRAITPWGY